MIQSSLVFYYIRHWAHGPKRRIIKVRPGFVARPTVTRQEVVMFNKILIPLDGSELAERALASAFTLAAQAEGEVHLLRVCAPEKMLVPNTPVFGGYGLLWPDQALETAEEEAKAYLAAIQKSKTAPTGAVS